MTVIYGETTYVLTDEAVLVQAGEAAPAPVELQSLPLPVARVLRAFRSRGA